MNKLVTLTILFGAFILSGCNEKTYTVSDFKNNKELLDEYRQKCKNGEIDGNSLNCENSHKALMSQNKIDNAKWN